MCSKEIAGKVRQVPTLALDSYDTRILAELHREADVLEEHFDEETIRVRCDIPPAVAARMLKAYGDRMEERDGGT